MTNPDQLILLPHSNNGSQYSQISRKTSFSFLESLMEVFMSHSLPGKLMEIITMALTLNLKTRLIWRASWLEMELQTGNTTPYPPQSRSRTGDPFLIRKLMTKLRKKSATTQDADLTKTHQSHACLMSPFWKMTLWAKLTFITYTVHAGPLTSQLPIITTFLVPINPIQTRRSRWSMESSSLTKDSPLPVSIHHGCSQTRSQTQMKSHIAFSPDLSSIGQMTPM